MTPFRSFVVTECTALTLTIMALLQLKGGTITYVVVSSSAHATEATVLLYINKSPLAKGCSTMSCPRESFHSTRCCLSVMRLQPL